MIFEGDDSVEYITGVYYSVYEKKVFKRNKLIGYISGVDIDKGTIAISSRLENRLVFCLSLEKYLNAYEFIVSKLEPYLKEYASQYYIKVKESPLSLVVKEVKDSVAIYYEDFTPSDVGSEYHEVRNFVLSD